MQSTLRMGLAMITAIWTSSALGFERKTSENKLEGVAITDSITLSELDGIQFKSVAQAVRSKKMLLKFKVYIGEVLMPTSTNWDGKSSTWETSAQAGVLLTFLRDVPAKNIAEAFEDSLKENGIKPDSTELKSFLEAVRKIGDIKEKEMLLIARNQVSSQDRVLILIPGRFEQTISGPQSWSQSILKIWTGKPTDSGVKDFQKDIFR